MKTKLALTLIATIAISSASSSVLAGDISVVGQTPSPKSPTAPPSHAPARDNPVVGEWVAATTTKGGLAGMRTFESNGTVIIAFGATMDFKYKLEDKTIVMTAPDGTSKRMDFTITNDTLTLASKAGPPQTLTRVKGIEGQGLVGKWTGKHYTGVQQVMDFTTSMNLYLSVPIKTETGLFVIEGDTLTEKFPNKDFNKIWNWKITKSVLTLTESPGSKVVSYKRKE